VSDANLSDPAVAADYDLIYGSWDAQVERVVQIMNGHLPVVARGRLLDASCASGLAVDAAMRIGWTVSGCDASPAMLQRAQERFPHVTLRAGNLLSLAETMGAHYDAVISVGNALLMIARPQVPAALAQMRACLHRGGALMLVVRDLSQRPKGGVWRDDPVARVTARFVARGPEQVVYIVDIRDVKGERSHELTLHPVSPLELESAVLASGFTVSRTSRASGRAVIAAHAV
jgi:ubiquinone/menaquinone biosynthesis C-methylase UbiE